MAGIALAPGEQELARTDLSLSVLLFWVKTSLAASSTRLVWDQANTLFGVIPLGHNEETTPLANTASVAVNTRFHVGRAVWGVIALILALVFFGNAWFLGLIFLLIAASSLLNAMSATFVVTNNGGGKQIVDVSILEKSKLESFTNKVKQQLFADHARLRHGEQMNVQQAQLNAHLAQNQQQPATPPAPPLLRSRRSSRRLRRLRRPSPRRLRPPERARPGGARLEHGSGGRRRFRAWDHGSHDRAHDAPARAARDDRT
ncbi:MAG TPA: hypothetical protein VK015_04605, partial [Microbacterium sp.]|nr:hypothetical protein [Microbacterium sp.]